MTRFSIIFPFYNEEDYIKESIKSIKMQSYQDFEVICINDKSQDLSYEILKNQIQDDKRFKIISNSQNKGLGASRNIALKYTTGEYIAYLDADDLYHVDFLKKSDKVIKKYNPDSIWVKFNIKNEINQTNYEKPIHLFNEKFKKGKNNLKENNLFLYPSFAWNKIYRKSSIIKSGAEFFENKLFEDIYFYYIFYSHFPQIYYIDESLYIYRKREKRQSIVDKVFQGEYPVSDIFFIINEVYKYFQAQGKLDLYRETLINEIIKTVNTFRQSYVCYEETIMLAKKLLDLLYKTI